MEGNERDNYYQEQHNLTTNGDILVQYIDDLNGQGIGTNGSSVCELVDTGQEIVVNTNNYDENNDDVVQRQISEINENKPIGYIDGSYGPQYVVNDKVVAKHNDREIHKANEPNGNSGIQNSFEQTNLNLN